MLSLFLNQKSIKLLDYLLTFPPMPFTLQTLRENASKKGMEEAVDILLENQVITCENPSALPEEKKYSTNDRSDLLALVMKVDFELSRAELAKRRQKIKSIDILKQTPKPAENNKQV